MPKLLHLRCSPRTSSASSAAAEAFLAKFRQAKPSWDIDLQDLWRETLPEFNGAALEAKYARLGGRPFSGLEGDAFAAVERLALRFSLAERVLISLPMWNFGVPYKLKQWFDLIVQPGLTFSFQPSRGLSRSGQGPSDGRDSGEWRRLRDRHEPGPCRHGDALPARHFAVHRNPQRAFRRGWAHYRSKRSSEGGSRRRSTATDGTCSIILTLALTRCFVPDFDEAFLSSDSKDALWDRFYTGAPQRQRRSVERYPEGACETLRLQPEDHCQVESADLCFRPTDRAEGAQIDGSVSRGRGRLSASI